jgi:Cu+-exporting ATPase
VADIVPVAGVEPARLLAVAAAVEQGSEHPLAAAIIERARADGAGVPAADGFEAVAGHGAHARVDGEMAVVGKRQLLADHGIDIAPLAAAAEAAATSARTPVFVAHGGHLLGMLAIADPVRPQSAAAVAALRRRRIDVWLVSGDERRVAEAIAAEVGIAPANVLAGVLPAGKADEIRRLQAAGRVVAMVGDGINDAPALAQADLGVAIGTGTDVALEASDVTLVGGDPRLVVSAIALSSQTMRIIRQNLFWAFAYNVVLIPVAMGALYPFFGVLLDPILAAAAMATSSVSVIANSLRLRRVDVRPDAGDGGRRSTNYVPAPHTG